MNIKKLKKYKKNYIQKKESPKLSWPISAKSDEKTFIQKEKKQNYHHP